MKVLRNKLTGEIGCLVCSFEKTPNKITVVEHIDGRRGSKVWYYDTLAELNEKWEDYEEPKEHWCITMYGGITRIKDDEEPIDDLIEIGNYFNSKEDAYDAWDKLKAWKRLKDKGFRFSGASLVNQCIYYRLYTENDYLTAEEFKEAGNEFYKDLDLLFREEEE